MKEKIKKNPQVTGTVVVVLVIAVLCLIFRYDGEYEGYYQIAAKEEREGIACFSIFEGDKKVILQCDPQIYDQLKEDSDEYYISYRSLRFGNGAGELHELKVHE